ncbi:MAG: hypothetical protein LUQ22_08965 [Methanotrichaceae archaeon]|nr:hypothetical protein [Methanotrichaceae archaeon]
MSLINKFQWETVEGRDKALCYRSRNHHMNSWRKGIRRSNRHYNSIDSRIDMGNSYRSNCRMDMCID